MPHHHRMFAILARLAPDWCHRLYHHQPRRPLCRNPKPLVSAEIQSCL